MQPTWMHGKIGAVASPVQTTPSREIEIVRADLSNAQHADSIVRVLDSYARDPLGGGTPLPSDVRVRLVPALREHGSARIWLAFVATATEPEPVGLAICFVGFSTFEARPLLNVHDLAVIPEYRDRRIGRALLEAVEQHALRGGHCKLTLEVQDDNTRARHLYARFGFRDFTIYGSAPTRFLSKRLGSKERSMSEP